MSKPTEVGSVVAKVLDELGLSAAQQAFEIAELWEAAVGEEVARHARPTAMKGGVLEVAVDSSVWAQQLLLRRPEILSALARVLEESEDAAKASEAPKISAPRDLRFRVGYTPSR